METIMAGFQIVLILMGVGIAFMLLSGSKIDKRNREMKEFNDRETARLDALYRPHDNGPTPNS